MPSLQHEAMVALLENSPELGVEFLHWLKRGVPQYALARCVTATLTEQSARGYRADAVVLLTDAADRPVLAVVIEIQRGRKRRKRYTWPLYQAAVASRFECPVELVVVPLGKGTAAWMRGTLRQIEADRRAPLSVADADVPAVIDVEEARQAPARAVFSAVWYGADPDSDRAALIAYAAVQACAGVERELGSLYFGLIDGALSAPAARKLEALMASAGTSKLGYFGQKSFNEGLEQGLEKGLEQGLEKGRRDIVLRQLELKFGPLPDSALERVKAAGAAELDGLVERVLTERTLEDVLGT